MSNWTVNKLIVLVLIGAFATLVFEVRSEHQAVLGEHVIAWGPIIYSALMVIIGLAAWSFWESWGRRALFWAFAVGLVVGALGFWQHNEEDLPKRIGYVLTVWGSETDEHPESSAGPEAGDHETGDGTHRRVEAPILPPVFAPLTFAGLGLLGMLASGRRFQPESMSTIQHEK